MPLTLTAKEVAEAFDLSYKTFQKLNVSPVRTESRGRQTVDLYQVTDVALAYAEWLSLSKSKKIEAKKTNPELKELAKLKAEADLEKTLAETAKIKADTEARLLKNEEFRKTLAPISLIELAVSKAIIAMGAVLDTIPMQVKKALPEEKAVVINIVAREVKKAQNAIAQIDLDLSVNDAESDDESLND